MRPCTLTKAREWALFVPGAVAELDALVTDLTVSQRQVSAIMQERYGLTVPHSTVAIHRRGECVFCATPRDELLDPTPQIPSNQPVPRPAHPSPVGPEITCDDSGQIASISLQVEGDYLNDPSEWKRLAESLTGSLPPGRTVVLSKAKYNPNAWIRTEQWSENDKGERVKTPATTVPAWSYEFRVVDIPTATVLADSVPFTRAVRNARYARPRSRVAYDGQGAMVVELADWQIAQADSDGLAGQRRRLAQIPSLLAARVAELRALGRPVTSMVLLGLGDLLEGCDGYYAQQVWRTQANAEEQRLIVSEALLRIIETSASLVGEVIISAVGGNHGENRREGKSFTDFADNGDVGVFKALKMSIDRLNPGLAARLRWSLPNHDLHWTVTVYGVVLGLAHGHTFGKGGGGAGAEGKVLAWRRTMAAAREPIGDAVILHTGHLHAAHVAALPGCDWMQAPALVGRSEWAAQHYGLNSVGGAGVATYHLDADGWRDWQVLRGEGWSDSSEVIIAPAREESA